MSSKSGFTIILLSGVLSACSHQGAEQTQKATAETSPTTAVATNQAGFLSADRHTQERIGLQTTVLQTTLLLPEIKGYGRVRDISPLAASVTELTTARAAAEASHAELDRVKSLATQNNASTRALQAAEAAATRDQAQLESGKLKLLTTWGAAIAERDDLPSLVQSLATLSNALVEIDLPPTSASAPQAGSARVMPLDQEDHPIEALVLGAAPSIDPQWQGKAFFLLVTNNQSRLIPGAAVSGFLRLTGEPFEGVTVPRAAILRHQAAAWVYLQVGEESFQRVELSLDHPVSEGWLIQKGLKPKDKIVTVGAQQLLSEELKGQGGEE